MKSVLLWYFFIFQYAQSQDFGHIFHRDFGYEGNIGPDFWGQLEQTYEECSTGKLQSPIDIDENDVKIVHFPSIVFENFESNLKTVKLENNGHTGYVISESEIDVSGDKVGTEFIPFGSSTLFQLSILNGEYPLIYGGPLKSVYNFSQLHFHWGRTDEEGSENQINNHSFPLELHMVFYNVNYEHFRGSLNHTDGLIVLSFLYEKSEEDNENYATFVEHLSMIRDVGSSIEIEDFVSLDDFSTTKRNEYFMYTGSLTTPPCYEVVTWFEFRKTIYLSHKQLQEFRLISGNNGKLEHNFRPIQPLYDRSILLNIDEE